MAPRRRWRFSTTPDTPLIAPKERLAVMERNVRRFSACLVESRERPALDLKAGVLTEISRERAGRP